MKRLLFGFVFLITVIAVSGQCAIDYTYYPVGANYGLDPDSLPDGYIGQFYDEDMTFYLPLDTTDPSSGASVTFEDFHITSISLPLGLTWECNSSANGCHYDPAVTQYGCVKVSGTPLIAGTYDVQVDLVATHNLSQLVGPEDISFILPLTILPDTSTSSNTGFAMSNPSGCAPVTVSFTNNNTGMLSYSWDFGNGNISTLENPGPQMYNDTGIFIVHYQAYADTNSSYFLTDIEVATADGWDGDADDGWGLLNPDPYIKIFNQSGSLIWTSSVLTDNNFPVSWTAGSISLQNQTYTIEVWDQDGVTNDDLCGSVSFQGFSNSGTITNGSETINYAMTVIPPVPITSIDTIYVSDYPAVPNLVYDTLNNLIYTSVDSIAMQWYYYNSPIPGATDTFINPTSSGEYSLVVVNEYGCDATSLEVLVVICDNTYQPILDDNGSTAWMLDSALYSNLQWHDSNGPINGANQPFFPATVSGSYYIVATDEFGCSYSSPSTLLEVLPVPSWDCDPSGCYDSGTGLGTYLTAAACEANCQNTAITEEIVGLLIYPNPVFNGFPLTICIENTEFSEATIVLMDLYGREVIRRVVNSSLFPYQFALQEISKLSNGLYYLDISFDENKIRKKIIKTGAN